jgi:hypothetical protein
MLRQVLVITGGLVVVYLLVSHATGAGKLLSTAGSVYTGGVKVLQGRG